MMEGSIVCGVDGSTESRVALRVAAQLSGQLGLRLVVAHVAQAAVFTPAYASMPIVERPAVDELHAGEELLDQLALDEGLTDASLRPLHGVPAERLADLADEEDAAFVVVGSRGRGAFKAAFLGSVSSDLIGVARCPVLVVPPGAGH
jgi:nucleotide-binding universal stress UspA family protein